MKASFMILMALLVAISARAGSGGSHIGVYRMPIQMEFQRPHYHSKQDCAEDFPDQDAIFQKDEGIGTCVVPANDKVSISKARS